MYYIIIGCLKECDLLLKSSPRSLTFESVQGASLPLQSVNHLHGGDGLSLGVFGVGDGIPDDVLEECGGELHGFPRR